MRACNWGGNQSQMREAIRGNQRQSEAIRGAPAPRADARSRRSEAHSPRPPSSRRPGRGSRAPDEGGHPTQSAPISDPREAPAHHDEGGHHAIRGNQRQSAAISGNQRSERGSRALSGLGGTSSRAGRRACRGRASRGPPRPSRPPRPPAPRARPRARVRTEEAP